MSKRTNMKILTSLSLVIILISFFLPQRAVSDARRVSTGNYGLPSVIDLPTAKRLPDGELVFTHQNHKYLFMNGISFQATPRLGLTFRYGGQGQGGGFAQGRVNWDRSFDAHFSILDEGKYFPAISLGLRDFIGTGWYSSEYVVVTKSIRNTSFTAGLGFGRLAGRNSFSNPLGVLSKRFYQREGNGSSTGGTLGKINWFQGETSMFYGIQHHINEKIKVSSEYSTDLMLRESSYLDVKSPWNLGIAYQFNDYLNFSAQQLHGNQTSITAQVNINPRRPPLLGGKELAPVPMRLRGESTSYLKTSSESVIRKVLKADLFKVHYLQLADNEVNIGVTNTKFRSTAQAVGRVASTLQRFTSDEIKLGNISIYKDGLKTATYRVDFKQITKEQFNPMARSSEKPSIMAIDTNAQKLTNKNPRLTWGVGPYIEHRLFNPDLPLSMETGLEVEGGYKLDSGVKLSGSIRKSVLTNLTKNKRLNSGSPLPRVHSSWPLYDLAGQDGHIFKLNLSYATKLSPSVYGRAHAGILGPFFAGIGAEVLYKPVNSPIGVGVDVHRVRQRDYDMLFDLRDYETTIGHISLYYDAGGMFDFEVNAGRYLAGDWGATTTISRKFGSGWEVGAYATLTDVPFETFGEGSFDKAVYISIPIDWIISSPNRTKRRLTLRPITRDGGANLSSARSLYRQIENSQNADFQRELGRLWK